ncbi:MAG: hypothetical protein HYS15_01230 [Candidatus Spechtbacteria bacterium]|nr:hypothetical protein [Candidatus Spechtbacteria bacterium]
MTRSIAIVFFVIFSFLLLFHIGAGEVQAGFGISPSSFWNDHLSPGVHYEQDIYLVQGNPEADVKATVALENAEEIKDWITIHPGKEFIIPKGVQQFPMRVIVDVPKDAGYAIYKGKIRVTATSFGGGEGKGSGVSLILGALADIKLTVTSEKISDFKVKSVRMPDIEEGWPIQIQVKLENLGNIKVRPTKIMLVLYDQGHGKELERGEAETTEWVNSFESGTIHATMTTKLGIGSYFGDFEIYKGESVVARDRQRFSIVLKGTLEHWPRFFGISVAWWAGGMGIVLTIFAGIKFNLPGKFLRKFGIEMVRVKKKNHGS